MPRKGMEPSDLRLSIESSGGKWFVYDHAFREIKAGPFKTRTDAKAAFAIIKSRARYTTSPRHHAEIGFKTKYPGGQKKHNAGIGARYTFHGMYKHKAAAMRKEKQIPRSFIKEKDGYYFVLRPKGRAPQRNGPVKIYEQCLRIEAIKKRPHTYGGKLSRAGQRYYHDFSTKNVQVFGLPDGSLLLKPGKK